MITEAKFMSIMEGNQPLTREEEYAVFEFYESHRTQKFRNMICEKNIGLARMYVGLVKSVANDAKGNYLEADDIFQESFIGLMTAVDKFDKNFGVKFSTYAVDWIKRSAFNYVLNAGSSIKIPYYVQCDIRKIMRAEDDYKKTVNGSGSIEDMFTYVKKNSGVSEKRINWYYSPEKTYGVISLNKKISADDGDECELIEFVGDGNDAYAESDARCDMKLFVEIVRDSVDEREFKIISMYYGLCGQREHTIDECAFAVNLTKKRTETVLKNAINKIKKSPDIYGISGFHNYIKEVS